jgi:hypothetical protein
MEPVTELGEILAGGRLCGRQFQPACLSARRGADRPVLLHRGVLQPTSAPFVSGRPESSGLRETALSAA